MLVEVRLFASFRKSHFDKKQMDISEGMSLQELLTQIKIPAHEAGILLVNGCGTSTEHILNDNDVVSVFPLIAGG